MYVSGLADRRADTLSFPDTKRVAIARALVSEPTILMLDEPAGGLGAQDIEWMNLLIRNLSAEMSARPIANICRSPPESVSALCDNLSPRRGKIVTT